MKIAFPVVEDKGLDSIIYDHFGSSPYFLIADTETNTVVGVANRDLHHAHGACNPVMALGGHAVDGIVVRGIGAGALARLRMAGYKVFGPSGENVRENIQALQHGALTELSQSHICSGHGTGHGFSHGCGH